MLKFWTRENTLKEEHARSALASIIIQYRLHTRVRVSGHPTCALYRYTNIYHVHYEKCIHLCIYYYYQGDGQNYGLNPSSCCTCTSHSVYIMQYRTPAYTAAAAAPVLILHRVVMLALITPSPSFIALYLTFEKYLYLNLFQMYLK